MMIDYGYLYEKVAYAMGSMTDKNRASPVTSSAPTTSVTPSTTTTTGPLAKLSPPKNNIPPLGTSNVNINKVPNSVTGTPAIIPQRNSYITKAPQGNSLKVDLTGQVAAARNSRATYRPESFSRVVEKDAPPIDPKAEIEEYFQKLNQSIGAYSTNNPTLHQWPNNSLIVEAHGEGPTGEFKFVPDPEFKEQLVKSDPNVKGFVDLIHNSNKDFRFDDVDALRAYLSKNIKLPTYPDNNSTNFVAPFDNGLSPQEVTQLLTPAEQDNISKFISEACNSEGGLCPSDIVPYLKNLDTAILTPKYNYGLMMGLPSLVSRDEEEVFKPVKSYRDVKTDELSEVKNRLNSTNESTWSILLNLLKSKGDTSKYDFDTYLHNAAMDRSRINPPAIHRLQDDWKPITVKQDNAKELYNELTN
jgi:hypothetical protein